MSRTATLPVCLGTFEIRKTQQMGTRCGVAFNAEVWRDGRCAGRLENGGNGGGTYFYPATAHDRSWWHDASEEFAPQATALQNAEFAEAGLDLVIEGGANASEFLADLLFDLATR